MGKKSKPKVNDMWWEATHLGVFPVEITSQYKNADGSYSYTVIEHREREHNHTTVDEQYLFRTKKEALDYALQLNDAALQAVYDGIHAAVKHSEALQQVSICMRQLLYEEQIQEDRRQRNESPS